MARTREFDHDRRRQIYEYVEREGAVEPERVRQDVLVRTESSSKPARSGAALSPSVPMDPEAFRHHVSILKRDGYLEEHDGKLRVAFPMDADAETVTSMEGTELDYDLLVAIPVGVLIAGSAPVSFTVAAPMMGVLTVATILLFTLLRTDLILTDLECYGLLSAYAVFVGWVIGETIGVVSLIQGI